MSAHDGKLNRQLVMRVLFIIDIMLILATKLIAVFMYKIFGLPVAVCCIAIYYTYMGKSWATKVYYCLTALIVLGAIMCAAQMIYKLYDPTTLLPGNFFLGSLYILLAILQLIISFFIRNF